MNGQRKQITSFSSLAKERHKLEAPPTSIMDPYQTMDVGAWPWGFSEPSFFLVKLTPQMFPGPSYIDVIKHIHTYSNTANKQTIKHFGGRLGAGRGEIQRFFCTACIIESISNISPIKIIVGICLYLLCLPRLYNLQIFGDLSLNI